MHIQDKCVKFPHCSICRHATCSSLHCLLCWCAESGGFSFGEDGGVSVGEDLQTKVPGVYAAGDVISPHWDVAQHWQQVLDTM